MKPDDVLIQADLDYEHLVEPLMNELPIDVILKVVRVWSKHYACVWYLKGRTDMLSEQLKEEQDGKR